MHGFSSLFPFLCPSLSPRGICIDVFGAEGITGATWEMRHRTHAGPEQDNQFEWLQTGHVVFVLIVDVALCEPF